uniref:Uncharacterized protein n=1 Tax=Glossina austeni TaxID=7395 RepID=A0A1A9UP49_GLOAU
MTTGAKYYTVKCLDHDTEEDRRVPFAMSYKYPVAEAVVVVVVVVDNHYKCCQYQWVLKMVSVTFYLLHIRFPVAMSCCSNNATVTEFALFDIAKYITETSLHN